MNQKIDDGPGPGPRWIRIVKLLLKIGVVALPLSALVGYRGFVYVKTNPNFCRSCHLMEDAFQAWSRSVHKEIACQTCHPAGFFEEMQLGWNSLIRNPDFVDPHKAVPVHVCKTCHEKNGHNHVASGPFVPPAPKKEPPQIRNTVGHREHAYAKDLDCLNCHVQKLHIFQPPADVCTHCHKPDRLKLTRMDSLHCVGCHDFLSTGKSLLPTASQCRTCHADGDAEEPVNGEHPDRITRAASRLHMELSKGKNAPVWKGHENCLGCHKPHREKLEDPVDCLRCHKQLLEGGEHIKDERLGGCLDCHNPHRDKDW